MIVTSREPQRESVLDRFAFQGQWMLLELIFEAKLLS
jgi:hypothetical protein